MLKKYLKESFITISIIIIVAFLFYRLGVWKGENNIAIKYNLESDNIHFNSLGEETRIQFRLFD